MPETRITVVRNGVELHELREVEPDRTLHPKGKTIIAYMGVMGFQDGVDYLLRALGHLVRDLGRTDFFCILVGGGEALAYLKSLTEELDISEHVLFTGMVDHLEVARYLVAAEVCVAPEPSAPYNDRSTAVKLRLRLGFRHCHAWTTTCPGSRPISSRRSATWDANRWMRPIPRWWP